MERNTQKILKSFWIGKRQKVKKGLRKISKFYWRKKKKKCHRVSLSLWYLYQCQYHCEQNENLSEEQKKKLVKYRRNYCITYNKQLFEFVEFLNIGQLNFLFHGLILEIWENSEIFYEYKYFFSIKIFYFMEEPLKY